MVPNINSRPSETVSSFYSSIQCLLSVLGSIGVILLFAGIPQLIYSPEIDLASILTFSMGAVLISMMVGGNAFLGYKYRRFAQQRREFLQNRSEEEEQAVVEDKPPTYDEILKEDGLPPTFSTAQLSRLPRYESVLREMKNWSLKRSRTSNLSISSDANSQVSCNPNSPVSDDQKVVSVQFLATNSFDSNTFPQAQNSRNKNCKNSNNNCKNVNSMNNINSTTERSDRGTELRPNTSENSFGSSSSLRSLTNMYMNIVTNRLRKISRGPSENITTVLDEDEDEYITINFHNKREDSVPKSIIIRTSSNESSVHSNDSDHSKDPDKNLKDCNPINGNDLEQNSIDGNSIDTDSNDLGQCSKYCGQAADNAFDKKTNDCVRINAFDKKTNDCVRINAFDKKTNDCVRINAFDKKTNDCVRININGSSSSLKNGAQDNCSDEILKAELLKDELLKNELLKDELSRNSNQSLDRISRNSNDICHIFDHQNLDHSSRNSDPNHCDKISDPYSQNLSNANSEYLESPPYNSSEDSYLNTQVDCVDISTVAQIHNSNLSRQSSSSQSSPNISLNL